MNELHQKLAVLSSSLNNPASPQVIQEQPTVPVQQVHVQPGNVVFSPIVVPQQTTDGSQMVVDSTTPIVINQQQQQVQQPQPQHIQQLQQPVQQMQTVVVNPMLTNSSSGSPMVLNVPANNGQMSGSSPVMQQVAGVPVIPAQVSYPQTVAAPVQNLTPSQQVQPPSVQVAHPSLVTATQSPVIIHSPSVMPHLHPSNHQINNDLANMNSTTPTTSSIVATNKLIEAVTHQGASGTAGSVSIRCRVAEIGDFTG